MKLRYPLLLGIVLVVQSVIYDTFFMNNPTKGPDIEQRIGELFINADEVCDEWLNCRNPQQFIDNLWTNQPAAHWKTRDLSIYLYERDTLRFWTNHSFSREVDSLIAQSPPSIEQFDDNTVLSFRSAKDDRRTIILIKLAARVDWFNNYVFPSEVDFPQFFTERPPTTPDDRQVDKINVLGRKFFVEVAATREMPLMVNLLGWLGIALLLWSINQRLRRGTTSRNAIQRLLAMALILIALRLAINYIDIPNGGSFSWSSLGSLLITYSFLLILVGQSYSMRFRLRTQVRAMTQALQYLILVVVTIFMCAVIVYFHYSMVELIRINTASIEIYNIFSLNLDSLIFYLVSAIFVAMRMLYSRSTEAVLSQFPYWARAVLSIVVLIIMVLPLEQQIVNTGFILVMFHSIFLTIYYLARKRFIGRQFVYDLVVFAAYIAFFSVIETFTARLETAKQYAAQIASRTEWEKTNHDQPPKSLWFGIIKPDEMILSENNNYELQSLLEVAAIGGDTIIVAGEMTHIVRYRQADRATIVVSFERPTFVRIVSLWCYIFLWLMVVSGAMLQVYGLKIYRHYNTGSMIYRVRTMVFMMVIISMGIVSIVVYRYSDQAYTTQQKNSLKVSVQELRSNFNAFAEADSTGELVMRRWLKVSNSSRTSLVSLFDTTGLRLHGIDNAFFLSRMNFEAYGALRYHGLPYFERLTSSRSQEYAVAYTPLYWQGNRVGYMGVLHLNPQNSYRKFELLSSIFNIFIIVLLLAVVLSMVIYTAITKPLNVLYEGLSGIRHLKKIDIDERMRLDDEVGTIIRQYNSMIDYLEESYLAVARSEREGAWREMARQVAHEIKNPLTPMRLKIQMLQRSRAMGLDSCEEQLDSTLEVLLEQIDILTRIASEFSDLARLPEGSMVRIELSGLLENTVSLYASDDMVSVRFVDQCAGKMVYVNVDYASMTRVVVNLLQNAMQAIDGGGIILVSLDAVDRWAIVEVRDNGRGISADVVDRMFEPNFTTKSSGSGLGLAICRQIIENFGGSITGVNGDCAGAVFTVRLPLA